MLIEEGGYWSKLFMDYISGYLFGYSETDIEKYLVLGVLISFYNSQTQFLSKDEKKIINHSKNPYKSLFDESAKLNLIQNAYEEVNQIKSWIKEDLLNLVTHQSFHEECVTNERHVKNGDFKIHIDKIIQQIKSKIKDKALVSYLIEEINKFISVLKK